MSFLTNIILLIHTNIIVKVMSKYKYDVFISYKRQSLNVVKAIVHVLESEGINCWYDSGLDENAGKDYADIIHENITSSRMLIAVLSNAAVESDWVRAEVMTAIDQKKLVIPFVVAELKVQNGLTMLLGRRHWIDAYPNPDRKFTLLLKNVKLALNDFANTDNTNKKTVQRFNIEEEDFSYDFSYDEGVALYNAKEYNDAVLAFMSSAERGNKKAKDFLCQIFYEQENDILAFDEEIWASIEQQAREGHCYANFLMHCKLYKDASSNLVAFEFLKKAISKNSIPLALLRMGIQYNWGMGVKQSHTLGMHYYNKALNMGCKEAYSYIAQEYRYGNDKIKKDINKAVELLTKGIELDDKRSYKGLTQLYLFDLKQKDKACEIAQKAIDIEYSKGYSLMGDIALGDGDVFEQNLDEAIKWYKKALLHDEKEAYGMLAYIYDWEGETEESFRMAKRGRMMRDSSSVGFLGHYYEMKGELENAWQCYKEQYDLFGIGAEGLAKIVIEYNYLPKDVETEEEKHHFYENLEQLVEVQARNGNEECLKALLKFCSYRDNGTYDLDYNIGRRIPRAFEIIRLGAETGISEMMYYLGQGLISDTDSKDYNPLKGLEWIGKAAEQGYGQAIEELLNIYKTGIWEDKEEYKKIVFTAIQKHSFDNLKLFNYLKSIALTDESEKAIAKDFLNNIIKNDKTIDFNVSAISYLFKYITVSEDDTILDDIKKISDSILNDHNYGYIRQIGNQILKCYPEYNRISASLEYFNDENTLNSKLYYSLFDDGSIQCEIDVAKQDEVCKLVMNKIRDNVSFDVEEVNHKLFEFLYNFKTSYEELCKQHSLSPLEYFIPAYKDSIPFIMSGDAIKVWRNTLQCLLTLRSYIPVVKEIIETSKTFEEILDIAEKDKNEDIQMLLVEVEEIAFEVNEILKNNSIILYSFDNQHFEEVVKLINEFVDKYNSSRVGNQLDRYTIDDVRNIYEQSQPKKLSKESVDDFDKLLNDFIENEINIVE